MSEGRQTTPTAERVSEAIRELEALTTCRCDPAYTERELHDTRCVADYREDVDVLRKVARVDG